MGLTPEEFKNCFVKRISGWYRYTPEQLDDVYQAIKSATAEDVEKAVTAILENSTYKPKISEIRKALGFGRTFAGAKATGDFIEKLKEKEVETKCKISEYVDSFMATDSLAREAAVEGWDADLEKFVYHTATTMQDMVENKKGYGWSSHAVPRDYLHVYQGLLKQASFKVRQDGIDVLLALPNMAPAYWRNKALREQPAPTPTQTKFEAHCNAIIERLRGEFEKSRAVA